MYVSFTKQIVNEEIIKVFTYKGSIRVLFATVTFSMGIDCSIVHEVIHLSPPSDTEL